MVLRMMFKLQAVPFVAQFRPSLIGVYICQAENQRALAAYFQRKFHFGAEHVMTVACPRLSHKLAELLCVNFSSCLFCCLTA